MRRDKPPLTAIAPPGCIARWQRLILKKLSALEADIASKPFQPLPEIEGKTFLQIAVTDSSVAVSSLCLEEQRAVTHRYSLPCDRDPTVGGAPGAFLTEVDEIIHMVEHLENQFSILTFFNASSKSLRLTEFLNFQRKISRKLRIILKLLHDWEVVTIKDCGFIQIGQSNSFTFRNHFMKRVINYSSVEGVDTIFTMLLQRDQYFFKRYATYGAPVSHCSLMLVCRSVVQLKAHYTEFTQSALEANFCRSVIHFKGNQADLAPSLLEADFCHSIVHLEGNQIELALRLLQGPICRSLIRLNGNQVDFFLSLLQSQICRSPIRLNGNQVDLAQSSLEALVRLLDIRLRGNKVDLVLNLLKCLICRSLIRVRGNKVDLTQSSLEAPVRLLEIRLRENKVDLTQSSLEALVRLLDIRLRGNKVDLVLNLLKCLICRSLIRVRGNKVDLTQSSLEAPVRLLEIRLRENKVDLTQSSLEALVRILEIRLRGNKVDLVLSLLKCHVCRSLIRVRGNKVDFTQSSFEARVHLEAIRMKRNKVDLTQSSFEARVRLSAIRMRGNKVELFHTSLFCRGKEHATILSNRVHAMIAKPRIYGLPFRQKCVGDEDLPHVADPENPLQLRADDVDGRTEDDNDYTDKKDEDFAESFAVIRGLLRDIRNCLTKPAVTFNFIRCKHVQIGKINEMSFVSDEDWLDSASAD